MLPDIVDQMTQYVPLQPDIDEIKVKAASLLAQTVDIDRLIGEDALNRTIGDNVTGADLELKKLLIPPLCYYTYSRLLLNFHGSYTDSGYENDELAASRNEAKSASKEMKGVAAHLMQKVIAFLEEENPSLDIDERKLTPRVSVIGGRESR